MGQIGDPISTSVPSVGTAGPGYATSINTLLGEFKTRLTQLVPNASLTWTSDANLNGSKLLNVGYLTLSEQSSVASSPVGQIVYSGGEFYLVTAVATIQVTNNGVLNAAAVGGIGGDYGGANPALLAFDDSANVFVAWDDPATPAYAGFKGTPIQVVSTANQNFSTEISSAATGNRDFILPATNPAGVALLSINASGQLAHNTTIDVAPTFSSDIILAGSKIQRGPDMTYYPVVESYIIEAAAAPWALDSNIRLLLAAGTTQAGFRVPVKAKYGERITTVGVRHTVAGAGSHTWAISLYSVDATGAASLVDTASSSLTAGTYLTSLTVNATVPVDRVYYLLWERTATGAGSQSGEVRMFYVMTDQPA